MGKKTKSLSWKPVQLEGSIFNSTVDGLIGVEECLDYDLNAILSNKKVRKRKAKKINEDEVQLSQKRKKPEIESQSMQDQPQKKNKKKKQQVSSKAKPLNDVTEDISVSKQTDENLEVEEMHAWNSFGLPKSLLEAIHDQGFKEPTPIQALTLPAAVFGRRDILGAAETGSGKTLAFGLPILSGILKLKENEASGGNNESEIDNELDDDDVDEDENDSSSGDENNQILNEECDEEEEVNTDEEQEENTDEEADQDSEDESKDHKKYKSKLKETGCVKVIDNICIDKSVQKPLYALILTPTRELAIQVKNHLIAAAKHTGIRVAVVLGGMAVVKQERVLSKGPEIVVATPGRLWELIQEGNAHLSQVDDIRFLAIDETDRMVERGHFKELHDLLERINADENKRKRRQNFVFSATLTLVHELPRHLAVKKKMKTRYSRKISKTTPQQKLQKIIEMLGISNPKVVDVTQKSGTAEMLAECRITCGIEEKDYYVYYFLQRHPGRTLVFCNSIGCVKRLTTLLGLLGCSPLALHASMAQRQRLKNLDRFRDNENGVLIATDVAARGLDIPCVEHVLHYQTPRTSESYVHRSGRTARATREGITVLLIEPSELPNYLRLCRTLGRTQDLPLFPIQENMLQAVKQRVKLARELDKLDLHVKKANSESGWIQKAAEEMDIVIDDNVSVKHDMKEARGAKKAADVKRKQLAKLLTQPLFPRGFSANYPLVFSAAGGKPYEPEEQTNERAVDVLKNSIENYSKQFRKKAKWLFKPKSWENSELKDVTKVTEDKSRKNKKRVKAKKL